MKNLRKNTKRLWNFKKGNQTNENSPDCLKWQNASKKEQQTLIDDLKLAKVR